MTQLIYTSVLLLLGVAFTSAQLPLHLTCSLPTPDDYTCGYEGNLHLSADTYWIEPAHPSGLTNADVRSFFIRGASVGTIPTRTFEAFTNLQNLHVHDSSLFIFQTALTAQYQSLRNIVLSRNRQFLIQDNGFVPFPNCISLTIEKSDTGMLGEAVFNGLLSLQELTMTLNTNFIVASSIFTQLSNLITLRINDNDGVIALRPELFDGLNNLQNLYMERSDLRNAPNNAFAQLTNLQILDLSDNSMSIIQVSELLFINLDICKMKLNHISLFRLAHLLV